MNSNNADLNLKDPKPFRSAYRNVIKNLIVFLRKRGWHATAMIFGTLLIETWQSIKSGCACPLGWKKNFNYHNLNPLTITADQAAKPPTLLIHGNFHNQSAWLHLAKKLNKRNVGPVYTVNLPHGAITDHDYAIISNKIEQIQSHYKQHNQDKIKINVVGHSRGGFVAYKMAWRNDRIGKVIKVGSVLDQEEIDRLQNAVEIRNSIYEITGRHDVLVRGESLCHPNQLATSNTGHLGLLYCNRTQEQIIQWLSN